MPTLNIRVMPNSGHHFYFFPIVFDLPNKNFIESFQMAYGISDISKNENLKKAFSSFVAKNHSQWQNAKDQNGHKMPWLRYCLGSYYYDAKERFNFNGCKVWGIWLGIESATGSRERGHTWFAEQAPAQDQAVVDAQLQLALQGTPLLTPYIAIDEAELFNNKQYNHFNLLDHCELDDGIINAFNRAEDIQDKVLNLQINWLPFAGGLVNVSLIVDLGNSRTTVMGFEVNNQLANNSNLSQVCRPISFPYQMQDAKHRSFKFYGTPDQLPESWFILKQPQFETSEFIPDSATKQNTYDCYYFKEKKKDWWMFWNNQAKLKHDLTRIEWKAPQMFVSLSPTAIGPKAKNTFAMVDIANMGNTFLSAPKRYLWDTDPVGYYGHGQTYWHMVQNDGTTKLLEGEMLCYMDYNYDADGYPENPFDRPLPERPLRNPTAPNYSRSDSLIWLALSIIEHAWEQINSESWRKKNQQLIRRRLKDIVVTYPPGWTAEEYEAYYHAWDTARHIFYWSRFPYMMDNEQEYYNFPELKMNIDEAIASQLPIIYANLRHLSNSSRIWCQLYGKKRYPQQQETVRVISLDIGGGTTDTAIVDYTNTTTETNRISLTHKLLFHDSSIIAGDNLVFEIINHFILPRIGENFTENKNGTLENFKDILRNICHDQANRISNSLLIKTAFMPLVIKWFEELKKDTARESYSLSEAAEDTAADVAQASEGVEKFNEFFYTPESQTDILDWEKPFTIDYEKLSKFIKDWAKKLTENLSRFIAALDCDLVIISGKISELPQIKSVLQESLPIEYERLIFVHNTYVGDWFPGSLNDHISDAKMVTVTGAALYHAMRQNFIDGWDFNQDDDNVLAAENYWGRLDPANPDNLIQEDDALLKPNENCWQIDLIIGDMIGRTRFLHTALQPVYKLRWNIADPAERQTKPSATVTVTLERKKGEDCLAEHLVITHAEGFYFDANNEQCLITTKDIELKLQTLPGNGEYWLDSGILNTTALDQPLEI